MSCLRMDLRKRMTAYLHGELPPEMINRLEDHLSECESCRTQLEQLRSAEAAMAHLKSQMAPESAWNLIEAHISAAHKLPATTPERGRYMVRALAGVAAALGFVVLFMLWSEGPVTLDRGQEPFSAQLYHSVALSDIPNNEEPHVTTVGYVSEVSVDAEEGDTKFRLVDNLQSPSHFIICEIIPPMDMKLPEIGSRIRVYGVSRYDGKAEHQWFELHPVMNIEPIR